MFYYQFHIGDFTLSTHHLEPMEELAYRKLLDLYYMNEGPIPNDPTSVARRIRVGSELVAKVLEEFFELTAQGWKHDRCELEIAKFRAKQTRGRVNGKLNKSRGCDDPKPKRKRNGTDIGSKSEGNHKPLTINQHIEPEGFVEFWKAYPKKVGKPSAMRAWLKSKATRPPIERILKAVADQASSPDWKKNGGQFIPHPSTWLNDERWNDMTEKREFDFAGIIGPTYKAMTL